MVNLKQTLLIVFLISITSVIIFLSFKVFYHKQQVAFYKKEYTDAVKLHSDYVLSQQIHVAELNKTYTETSMKYQNNIIEAMKYATEKQKNIDAASKLNLELTSSLSKLTDLRISDLSSNTSDANGYYATTFAGLFRECQSRYGWLGKEASGHAKDSLTLQIAYPKQEENKKTEDKE